jgi:hypothetical protein
MSRDVFTLSVAAPRQRWKLVLPLFTNNNNNNNNICCQLIAEFQVWLASVSVSIMFYDALGDLPPRSSSNQASGDTWWTLAEMCF